ncbi:MAG: hypothetical protein JNM00_14655 [Flavobacteriales bacterium]|nr:hypothetical protein [Flavobacteriales bacterium]
MNNNYLWVAIVLLLSGCRGQSDTPLTDQRSLSPPQTVTGEVTQQLGNNVMAIFEDSKGIHWFGSWEDGLYSYDGNSFTHYTAAHGLPHDRVEDIQEDKSGNILVNTVGGVCRFDGKAFTKLEIVENGEWKLHLDDLWFKSLQFDGKVYRYDGEVLHHLALPKCELDGEWTETHQNYVNACPIYSIYTDKNGYIWFGSAWFGACRYNGDRFDWICEEDVTELHDGPSNGVRSIIEDKDGYFWFNSAYRYSVNQGVFTGKEHFYERLKSIGNLDGQPDSDFWEYMSIARDNNDVLWIATYGNGVWRYDGRSVTNFPVQSGGEDINVFCIYKDRHGDLWLGTHAHGAYKFDGKTFRRFMPK